LPGLRRADSVDGKAGGRVTRQRLLDRLSHYGPEQRGKYLTVEYGDLEAVLVERRELREALKRRVLDCDHSDDDGKLCDWCREDRALLGWPSEEPG
jgi:hypothetical protein